MIKTYGTDKITSYKLTLDNKNILLDFGAKTINKNDVIDVDYIFISHEHLDHYETLLKYEIVQYLKPTCQIFSTKTTKQLIQYLVDKFISKYNYIEEAYNFIKLLISNIKECYFNEQYELTPNLSFTLFRSGHTFGSSMVYLNSPNEKILYTGDFDYIKQNQNRQYEIPMDLQIDTLIVDGTNLVKNPYKGIQIDEIRSYISRKKIIRYQVKPEKAIFYALYLADRLDDCVFVYTGEMKNYLQIISSNGYKPYINNKVIYALNLEDLEYEYPNKKIVIFSMNKGDYLLDTKLGLHITTYELKKFLTEKLLTYPKTILVGHYSFKTKNEMNLLGINNIKLLDLGENYYD